MEKSKVSSNLEWEQWGKIDPLYGVASWEGKDREGTDPWTDDAFYELGRSDWEDFLLHWQRYGVDDTSCLEIGCGAGRITMHLANYFRTTYALDISPEMIAYAQRHIQDPSVVFIVADGATIPLPNEATTAIFSTHVFQHFDALSHATSYFTEISRVLTPGGTIMIHLPMHNWPTMPRIFNLIYALRKQLGTVKASVRRRLMEFGLSRPIMRGLSYPLDYFYDVLPELGFEDVEMMVFATKSNGGLHPFVLARKP